MMDGLENFNITFTQANAQKTDEDHSYGGIEVLFEIVCLFVVLKSALHETNSLAKQQREIA